MDLVELLIAKIERRLLAVLDFHPHLERNLMSIAEQLKAAADAQAAALAGLDSKVDSLITLASDAAAQLAALTAGGATVAAADVQAVIDSLTAGTAAASAEGDKVAAALAAAAPAPTPAPAPAPAPTPVLGAPTP